MSADPKAVDVLAVLRSRANRTDNNGLYVVDETLLEACAAVVELIEADRGYDEARAALTGRLAGDYEVAMARLNRATSRRALALAAVGGV